MGANAHSARVLETTTHALADRAFNELGLDRLVAVLRPESKRVLAKAGLHTEGVARHYGADVEVWAVRSDGGASCSRAECSGSTRPPSVR